jgi:hypothetical protein
MTPNEALDTGGLCADCAAPGLEGDMPPGCIEDTYNGLIINTSGQSKEYISLNTSTARNEVNKINLSINIRIS